MRRGKSLGMLTKSTKKRASAELYCENVHWVGWSKFWPVCALFSGTHKFFVPGKKLLFVVVVVVRASVELFGASGQKRAISYTGRKKLPDFLSIECKLCKKPFLQCRYLIEQIGGLFLPSCSRPDWRMYFFAQTTKLASLALSLPRSQKFVERLIYRGCFKSHQHNF